MKINNMMPRNVVDAIRNHLSVQDICKKYECTEEEFLFRMSILYKHSFQEKINEINSSAKKNRGKSNKTKPKYPLANPDKPSSEIERIIENVNSEVGFGFPFAIVPSRGEASDDQCDTDDGNIIEDDTAMDDTVITDAIRDDSIEDLRILELKLQDEVIALEGQKKDASSKKHLLDEKFSELDQKIKSLHAQLKELEDQYLILDTDAEELCSEADEVDFHLLLKQEELECVRTKIAELEITSLTVTLDGDIIVTGDNTEYDFDDRGYLDALMKIVECGKFCHLSIAKAKTLANLLIIKNSNDGVRFIFEDEELEDAFSVSTDLDP